MGAALVKECVLNFLHLGRSVDENAMVKLTEVQIALHAKRL